MKIQGKGNAQHNNEYKNPIKIINQEHEIKDN